ncbi:MAG: hypothetical protein LUM44_13715 [Pyrinomonadaceae bacterium]|nr:hypothetical protein [Pyrinomonadaceae bacterium]
MNIFEDLIEELKEENLLENTPVADKQAPKPPKQDKVETFPVEAADFILDEEPQTFAGQTDHEEFVGAETNSPMFEVASSDIITGFEESETINASLHNEQTEAMPPDSFETSREFAAESDAFEFTPNDDLQETDFSEHQTPFQQQEHFYQPAEAAKPVSEKEFYRKRAMEEVSGLQMVEHVISGVEREQMKVAPKPYDDLGVKKALHMFIQVVEDVDSPEHAQTEYQLMQETQNWCSALSHRDRRISVAHLRRYCETTRPVLSSQALLALARFYRNLPYTESVRSKFDLVITKLFSRELGKERRELVFTKDEMTKHLKDLYAEWESIQLYPEDEKCPEIVQAIMKFKDFINEAEKALNFDELVANDFFNRLRLYKESTNELFFAPSVAVAAIECNIHIGNQYVELIERERRKANSDTLQDKYGFLHDQAISDATSKTLQLVELLREINAEEKENEDDGEDKTILISAESLKALQTELALQKEKAPHPLAINKWLAILLVLVCLVCGSLYVWVEYFSTQNITSEGVKKVNVQDSYYKEYFQTARISEETYYAVATPAWDLLDLEKREEILKNILNEGQTKGYRKIQILDKKGRTVGQGNANGVTIQTAPE